jgi:hypothetical protein
VGRVSHPDAPEQKAAGVVNKICPIYILHDSHTPFDNHQQPVYAPSAIAARGGKFRHIPGTPGYVTVRFLYFPQVSNSLTISILPAHSRPRSMDYY